jgi:hypothetical protein
MGARAVTMLPLQGRRNGGHMEPMSSEEIERSIAEAREVIKDIGERADERAFYIEKEGYTFGTGPDTMYTPTAVDFPKYHPVWSDDIRHEIWKERIANIETGPLLPQEYDLKAWPPAYAAHEEDLEHGTREYPEDHDEERER